MTKQQLARQHADIQVRYNRLMQSDKALDASTASIEKRLDKLEMSMRRSQLEDLKREGINVDVEAAVERYASLDGAQFDGMVSEARERWRRANPAPQPSSSPFGNPDHEAERIIAAGNADGSFAEFLADRQRTERESIEQAYRAGTYDHKAPPSSSKRAEMIVKDFVDMKRGQRSGK